MAKVKKLSLNQVLTRLSIVLEGQTADVVLPPVMAIVSRLVLEAAKQPQLAQYMYRHLSMAKANLESLTVEQSAAPESNGVLGAVPDETVNIL